MLNARNHFPSLQKTVNGRTATYLDGPAGTQVPQVVIDAIAEYYQNFNANTHGQFATSHETDVMLDQVRKTCAVFLNADGPECISFGQNMTSLCFSLSRGLGRMLKAGDEVVITQLDHEANRGPWLTLQDRGVHVREIRVLSDGTLDYDDAARKINNKTKIVAAGLASNMLGTINDLKNLRALSNRVDAYLVVDAVHSAPHDLTDVQALDCDFLMCSAYKFYGPHVGILYSKPGLLDQIPTDRLRVQAQHAPYLIETGTLNFAALAGVGAAIDFIASHGDGEDLRECLEMAFGKIRLHEQLLAKRLWTGLQSVSGVTLYGPDFENTERAPTISFTIDGMTAESVCRQLGEKGIFCWDGHFYAIKAAEVLGLLERGGVVRMGVVMYNTEEEIDSVLDCVKEIAG